MVKDVNIIDKEKNKKGLSQYGTDKHCSKYAYQRGK